MFASNRFSGSPGPDRLEAKMICSALGAEVAAIRQRRGLSIDQVASKVGMTEDQVQFVELGDGNLEELQKICQSLNLEIVMQPSHSRAFVRELD